MISRRLLIVSMLAACLAAPMAFGQSIASKVDYVGTSRHLKVKGLKVKDATLLTLYVEVENTDYDDQQGYYRLSWMDESGFPAWEEEAWKPILVHGGQVLKLQIVAPTAKARDFKIEFSGDRNWAGPTRPDSN